MPQIKHQFAPDKLWIGITPTSWWNDDFLDIDAGISFGQCVSEMALAGFEGCSVGHKYPTDINLLRKELDLRNLRVSEPWTSLFFTENDMEDKTEEDFDRSLKFIKAMGGTDIVVAELGHSVHQRPLCIEPNRPKFVGKQWKKLVAGLNKLGKQATKEGMNLCYHPHIGTGVETSDEIDKLMLETSKDHVHLLFDTGHLYFAECNPLDVAKKHADRIKHVHLKNVRRSILEKVNKEKLSFHDAIIAGIFTVPGDVEEGAIDFVEILDFLAEKHFSGWLIVEAEQDPRKTIPLEYAKMARKFLRDVTGL